MGTSLITISFTASGYETGDYAVLYGNSGAGDIDYTTPVNNKHYNLLPAGQDEQTITAQVRVRSCGNYAFAFKTFDAASNESDDASEEISLEVHVVPDKASKLKKSSYDPATDILVLELADA